MPDKRQTRQKKARKKDQARKAAAIKKVWRERRRDPRFVHVVQWSDGPGPDPGNYKVSKSETLMILAEEYEMPIYEIKKILGIEPLDPEVPGTSVADYNDWKKAREAKREAADARALEIHTADVLASTETSEPRSNVDYTHLGPT